MIGCVHLCTLPTATTELLRKAIKGALNFPILLTVDNFTPPTHQQGNQVYCDLLLCGKQLVD